MPEQLKKPYEDQGKATKTRAKVLGVVAAIGLTAFFAFK